MLCLFKFFFNFFDAILVRMNEFLMLRVVSWHPVSGKVFIVSVLRLET